MCRLAMRREKPASYKFPTEHAGSVAENHATPGRTDKWQYPRRRR